MRKLSKIFPLLLTTILVSSCSGAKVHYETKDYSNNLAWHDDFLVCHFGDLHLSTNSYLPREFEYFEKCINSHPSGKKPDIIILNGDNFMDANKEVVVRTFDFFNKQKIPFCFTYGNHDVQGEYSPQYIERIIKDYDYALYSDTLNDDVFGNSNYVVNLKENNELKYQIILMDSNSYYANNYDVLHDDQIAWYKRMILENNGYNTMPSVINDNTFAKSLVFAHIPFLEMKDVIEDFKDKHGQDAKTFGDDFCDARHKVGAGYKKTEMLKVASELKSTVMFGFNHDHTNSTDIGYKYPGSDWNMRLVYGMKTGAGFIHDSDMIGASFYTLYDEPKLSKNGNKLYFDDVKMYVPYEGEAEIIWKSPKA